MKLKKLLKGLPDLIIKGPKEIEITGITANSKTAAPGSLFIAKRGALTHGAKYIPEAINGGAVAVLTDMYDPTYQRTTQIIHPKPSLIEAHLAEVYYRHPCKDLFMVGITGTNGKTTAAYLTKHLLERILGPCGLIGTVEYLVGAHSFPAVRTTPDVIHNNKLLHEMITQGCKAAVMEVTSHALSQGRVDGLHYDAAIFTNLSQDHLDYHGSMEAYCDAKRSLFQSLEVSSEKKGDRKKAAIINGDDPWAERILHCCQAPLITYGIEQHADISAKNIVFRGNMTFFDLCWQGETHHCKSPLVGRFNVYNVLAAAAIGILQGVPLRILSEWIASFDPVPGRLQPVKNRLGLRLYVDFAHTEDALRNLLATVKEMDHSQIIIVFGCGGDRDKSKRPKMGKVCSEYSDKLIITNDNPRSEDPAAIANDILAGVSQGADYEVILDRKEAIARAISIASPKDIVLIAGKGHEKEQIFAHHSIEFDDIAVAEELCRIS